MPHCPATNNPNNAQKSGRTDVHRTLDDSEAVRPPWEGPRAVREHPYGGHASPRHARDAPYPEARADIRSSAHGVTHRTAHANGRAPRPELTTPTLTSTRRPATPARSAERLGKPIVQLVASACTPPTPRTDRAHARCTTPPCPCRSASRALGGDSVRAPPGPWTGVPEGLLRPAAGPASKTKRWRPTCSYERLRFASGGRSRRSGSMEKNVSAENRQLTTWVLESIASEQLINVHAVQFVEEPCELDHFACRDVRQLVVRAVSQPRRTAYGPHWGSRSSLSLRCFLSCRRCALDTVRAVRKATELGHGISIPAVGGLTPPLALSPVRWIVSA